MTTRREFLSSVSVAAYVLPTAAAAKPRWREYEPTELRVSVENGDGKWVEIAEVREITVGVYDQYEVVADSLKSDPRAIDLLFGRGVGSPTGLFSQA